MIGGIAAVILGADVDGSKKILAILLGLGLVAYGAKIFLTRTSYWVNTGVYLLAFVAVILAFGAL